MGWDRPIGQIGEVWTVEWRNELLARKRLEFRAICFNDVEDAASGPRFRKRALEHVLAQRPPERDFDPVFLLEGLCKRPRLGRCHGRIKRERAFLARFCDQPLRAIGAVVKIDCGVVCCRGLRAGADCIEHDKHDEHKNLDPRHMRKSPSAAAVRDSKPCNEPPSPFVVGSR